MKTPKTPRDNADEFLKLLDQAGFKPSRWDHHNSRLLDRKSREGHPDLRICINYEGEPRPHNLQLVKFDGKRSQIIQWESSLAASMPLAGVMALIKAA